MPTRTLYLVRHGQYVRAGAGREQDGELTDLGRTQSELLARRLSDIPIEVIRHSTMRRAEQTAEIIAKELPDIELCPMGQIRECVPCRPAVIPTVYRDFFSGLTDSEVETGQRRAGEAASALFRNDDEVDRHELVVTHGNLIAYLASLALGAPPGSWIRTDMYHCAITQISMNEHRGLILISHNDSGHLPLSTKTLA